MHIFLGLWVGGSNIKEFKLVYKDSRGKIKSNYIFTLLANY